MGRTQKKDYLIRLISASKGITRQSLSEKSGSSLGNIWRAEAGRLLSDNVAIKIAEVIGISPDIMFYNMGAFPPDKREFVMKDPLFFKELIDKACAEPWKLTKTKQYMEDIKAQMNVLNPEIEKMLSRIKPTE
jgi:transcriptional regulator with XRE-family HTH domain